MRHWFLELGGDLAEMVGPCTMYTSLDSDRQIGDLRVLAAPPYRKDSDLRRLWSWLRYFVGAFWLTWRTSPRAVLFIVAQPPYLPILGYVRNILFGQEYVVWVDDVYPDVLVRHGRLSEKNLIVRVWGWLNRLMLRRAARVFTLGPCMAEVLGQYMPNDSAANDDERVLIVPTWVDSTAIRPLPKEENPFARQHGQVDKLTVLYSGNLGLSHDLGTMVEAARRLQDQQDIHFMIIGAGSQWADLEKAAQELDNLTLLPYQPEEMLPYSLTTGDVAVVSLDRKFEGISMPSKTYYAMAAGAAVLGLSHRPSDLQMVIEQHECGVNVEPGDGDGFVEAVMRFRSETGFLDVCRERSRRAAEMIYSRQVNVRNVMGALEDFLPSQAKVQD